MSSLNTRPPGKQGSWYLRDPEKLQEQLEGFLAQVPDQIDESELPIPGARIIIAPYENPLHPIHQCSLPRK